MKHLGISGGGTKIAGLFGAAEVILKEKNYQPDVISGISAGALLSVPLALGKFEAIEKKVLDFDFDDFFNVRPITRKGKIRIGNAILKLIGGKHYLGKQDRLEKTLSDMVSERDFNRYKSNDSYPRCIVGSVDFYTGKRFYIDLKKVNYFQFLKFVNASASLPIFTAGVEYPVGSPTPDFMEETYSKKALLYDGGVRDHSPSAKVIGYYGDQITETCTLYSRTKRVEDMLNPDKFSAKNLAEVLLRYVDITNVEVSKNDGRYKKILKKIFYS